MTSYSATRQCRWLTSCANMAGTVDLLRDAARELRRLDRQIGPRPLRFLEDRVRRPEDARSIGEPLCSEWFGADC
mgnify:CR=1 FL=1